MQTWFFLLLLRVGIARVGLNRQGTGGGRDEATGRGKWWMHRNQPSNCYSCWEIVFKVPNLSIYYQHLGQQSSQSTLVQSMETAGCLKREKMDQTLHLHLRCACTTALLGLLKASRKCRGSVHQRVPQLLKLQWDDSSMQKRQREQHNQKEQFLVAAGLLNQFSYLIVYLQC